MSSRRSAERRQREGHHVQPVEQILAETARRHPGLDVAMGRGNHAHIDIETLRRSDRPDLPFLQHAQQLDLQRDRHIADFIEEKRALVCRLKQALVIAGRAGERAFDVAEQLGLQQRLRNRPAIDRNERMAPPRAGVVYGPCQQLFAGARFAVNEHARVAVGDEARLGQHVVHHRIAGDDLPAPVLVAGAVSGRRRTAGQGKRPLDLGEQDFGIERLGEIAEHAALHGRDGIGNRPVRGENDHRQRRVGRADRFEQRHAVHPAHPEIGDDEPGAHDAQACQRLFGARRNGDGVAGGGEPDLHQAQQIGVVIDDENILAGSGHGFRHRFLTLL